MTAKRPSLAQSMRDATLEQPMPTPTPVPVTESVKVDSAVTFHAATRVGKKKVTANLTPAGHKQLKSMAVDLETTTEALLIEAIADLMRKKGRIPL